MRNNKPNVLVHPCAVIRVFDLGIQTFGGQAMEKDNAFQASREAWITAVLLIGRSLITGQMWRLEVNPEENSVDDCIAYTFKPVDAEKTERLRLPVQVFERPKTAAYTLFEAYERKIVRHDLRNIALVCYSNKSETINFIELGKKIKELNPNAFEIWLVGNIPNEPRRKIVTLLYPDKVGLTAKVDLDLDYQKSEPSFVQPFFGKRKGAFYEPLHESILLKPNFEFEDL